MAAAEDIVRQIQGPGCNVNGLMKKYRCGYPLLTRAILSQISKAQWRKIVEKKVAVGNEATRFEKGHKTWNKGRKGWSPPGTEKTRFKKGHLPHNHRHVGSTRINERTRKGNTVTYKEIKVAGIMQGRHKWIAYAKYIWQQANGPVSKGMLIVHVDGDTLNDSLDNLKLVDRKGHLALQMERDPKMIKRCRKKAARTVRKMHAKNRRIKAAGTADETKKRPAGGKGKVGRAETPGQTCPQRKEGTHSRTNRHCPEGTGRKHQAAESSGRNNSLGMYGLRLQSTAIGIT